MAAVRDAPSALLAFALCLAAVAFVMLQPSLRAPPSPGPRITVDADTGAAFVPDTDASRALNDLADAPRGVSALALSDDTLVAGCLDGGIHIFRRHSGAPGGAWAFAQRLQARERVNAVALSPDGAYLAACGDVFTLAVATRDAGSGVYAWSQSLSAPRDAARRLRKDEHYGFLLGRVTAVAFSPAAAGEPLFLAAASGGWERGTVGLLQLAGRRFTHTATYDGFFTKWCGSLDFVRGHGSELHLLASSPDQSLVVLEVTDAGATGERMMHREPGALLPWFERDARNAWQPHPRRYDPARPRGATGQYGLTEFAVLSNNIQNGGARVTRTNNFVRDAKWTWRAGAPEFVTIGHEAHVRMYRWNAAARVFNATEHWIDTDAAERPFVQAACHTGGGGSTVLAVTHDGELTVLERDSAGEWRRTQRMAGAAAHATAASHAAGVRALALSPDGTVAALGADEPGIQILRRVAYSAGGETVPAECRRLGGACAVGRWAAPLAALPRGPAILDRHYRIE